VLLTHGYTSSQHMAGRDGANGAEGSWDGLVAVVSAPKGSGGEAAVKSLVDSLAKDPNWNGGWYYDKGGITDTLTDMRVATLRRYGIDEQLRARPQSRVFVTT
jgi:homoserine acetyltransferase